MNWHVFQLFDGYFLFDTPSNSLFRIDEPTYAVLAARELGDDGQGPELDPAVRREVEEELAELEKQGYLLKEDPFIANPGIELKPHLKALCLHLAHDCQLRCRYCFAGGGAYAGDRSLMTPEVGRAAVDLLVAGSGEKDQLEIDFFGGEPLLNRTLLYELVAYGEDRAKQAGKRLHFTLTTNTLELDREVLDFLRAHRMGLVLSLDGRREINDRMRGKDTHDRIVDRILTVVKDYPELTYYVRGTYTKYNLDFGEDVRHLYELGIRAISVEPVVCSPELPYAIGLADLPRIRAEYHRLAAYWWERYLAGDPFLFFHFKVDLEKGPCLPKRLLGCGAGFDYLAVTPQGELYPCHQFVGEAPYRLGDVFHGIQVPAIRERFRRARLYEKEGCAGCWARYYCSGGCHANAFFANGDILKPDRLACELLKMRLECGLGLKAMQMEREQATA
ncbi:MAG TPA: thioether cross-link-forming SCIFF peptide maturase [Bacillota bacterium]|nr:thioether cross-link-forming SCIFF peptide maturase [Bacillota bacterium]HPT68284.1 thioether cross-link-forming SCIFF peptide maturase [Bacillota bacterium]